MKRCYIIEMGGEKEVDEMLALELTDIDMARNWIQDSMKSDADYFNCNINCLIVDLKYTQYDSTTNFYYKGLVYIDADNNVNIPTNKDECSNVEDIIETNLSIISKITHKMTEVI